MNKYVYTTYYKMCMDHAPNREYKLTFSLLIDNIYLKTFHMHSSCTCFGNH